MQERPTPIEPRKLQRLHALRTRLQGQLAEVDMEIQRMEMGQQPRSLKDIFPKDIFWKQTINFDQTRKEQADQQSDNKQISPPS